MKKLKISRKRLSKFNVYVREYIDRLGLPGKRQRYSVKQNLFFICDRKPAIRDAIRKYGGKVTDEQVIGLAEYMKAHPIDGFSVPQSIIDMLKNLDVKDQPLPKEKDSVAKNPEAVHANPKIDRRIKKKQAKARMRGTSVALKKEFYSSWDWKQARYEVLKKYGPICMLCGAERGDLDDAGDIVKICVDHIKPLSTHWYLRLERTNMQILCQSCNQGKDAWDETDWRDESAA